LVSLTVNGYYHKRINHNKKNTAPKRLTFKSRFPTLSNTGKSGLLCGKLFTEEAKDLNGIVIFVLLFTKKKEKRPTL
jgi:hypothetical protein